MRTLGNYILGKQLGFGSARAFAAALRVAARCIDDTSVVRPRRGAATAATVVCRERSARPRGQRERVARAPRFPGGAPDALARCEAST